MKNKINIFSNQKIKNFLTNSLHEYELNLLDFKAIKYNLKNYEANIIILNNYDDVNLIKFRDLNDNFLIMSNAKNDLYLGEKFKSIKMPISMDHIKNTIKNFIQNLKIQFHDLSIHNEKLTNITNNSFCYLTKAELEILSHLIKEKETTKNFIKENILNIKSNIETNSLESHLTRIRKKMIKINTNVKIQTKSEKLQITI